MPKVGDAAWYYPSYRLVKSVEDDDGNTRIVELDDPKWADDPGKPAKLAHDEMFDTIGGKGMPAAATISRVRDDGTVDVTVKVPGEHKGIPNDWVRRRLSWGKPELPTEKVMVTDRTGAQSMREVTIGYACEPS